ncbi:MAG: hypothetical protein QGI83_08060, partial [Candidatus Latescibacteria bacterium]|nr:hypothetical protein [Candidatus Latescibacterota bacterium]
CRFEGEGVVSAASIGGSRVEAGGVRLCPEEQASAWAMVDSEGRWTASSSCGSLITVEGEQVTAIAWNGR